MRWACSIAMNVFTYVNCFKVAEERKYYFYYFYVNMIEVAYSGNGLTGSEHLRNKYW